MDQLWKWIMRLNAKAFCLAAVVLFFGTACWCAFKYLTPAQPFKDGGDKLPELPPAWEIGTLAIVSNQLAAEALSLPVDPFRPTIEAIFTNENERAAFIKALKAAQVAAAGGLSGAAAGTKKEDPFAHLRQKKEAAPGALVGPDGRPMVIPKLSFLGFFQRPDGKQAAMFYDSVAGSTLFYDAGKQVHGVDILSANVREAEIRFPDGATRKLEIGGNVELSPEPDTRPPPKKVAPAKAGAAPAKAGAVQAKAGAAPAKAGVKPQKNNANGAAQPKAADKQQQKAVKPNAAAKQLLKRQAARQRAEQMP